ncbi:NADPH-dependent FMN reductase [Photobacterium aquae]|uniref:NADPH-dependent FMN reductase n=1 Tax=Photobacterium aquae TaxID=1195763 RepID=A0A0J1GY69_9GAMM|nr:NADPH-dependent FMN reductase [Photobacterium aquae]KLV04615.1 NADPH-dependent FMN reductase [Photobacterium aquae]
MKKIIAFTGSNNSQSIHHILIQTLAAKANQTQVSTIDLNDFDLPMYGIDVETQGIPEDARRLRATLNEFDALIIASPEHNGSMPAFLKNAIDWLSRVAPQGGSFFGDEKKPVLLVSTSPGANGGATNLKTMAELMPWWGGDVKGTFSLGSFYDKFQNGQFDATTNAELESLMADFERTL